MKRKFIALFLAVATVCSSTPVLPGMNIQTVAAATIENPNQTVKNVQAPVLRGCTSIQVKKGETFDTKDVLSRVFAMDNEDGDLTSSITEVSNNVNTSNIGSYEVVYQVTDSGNKSDTISCKVEVVDNYAEEGKLVQRNLYTKASSNNTTAIGFNRGYGHDRQNLGIYMPAGSSLKIRIVNAAEFNQDLKVDLLADNQSKEETGKTVPKNGDWVTITSTKNPDGAVVPFIQTPQSGVEPVIEYYFGNTQEKLTYYYNGDDEDAFFAKWNENQQKFAVLDGERITMLVPYKDKDKIINNPDTNQDSYRFHNLPELFQYYQSAVEQFDAYAGLSYSAEDPIDENVRGKYFIKADASGAGAAYYSGIYTAQNSDTMTGYLYKNWLPIHEFAHGYEGNIARQEIHLVDVFNNVMCYFYERTYLVDGDQGWSELQDADATESRYIADRENHVEYNDKSFDSMLYTWVNLLKKIGPQKGMAALHHDYRTLIANKDNGRTSDIIAKSFSETSGYNVVPYLEANGLIISETVKAEIYEKNYPILSYLADSFESYEDAKVIEKKLDTDGAYALVTADDLAVTGKKGNVNIQLKIDDVNLLKGKVIRLKEGEKTVASAVVNGAVVTFENVPIGAYSVDIPSPTSGTYLHDYEYVLVKNQTTVDKTVTYTKAEGNALTDDLQIRMTGLGDATCAQIDLSMEDHALTIKTNAGQPHSVFSEKYYGIEVINPDGKSIYSKERMGTESGTAETQTVPMEIGTRIKLYHREPTRNMIWSKGIKSQLGTFKLSNNASDREVEYIVTKYGLMRSDWSEDEQLTNYMSYLNEYYASLVSSMNEEQKINKNSYIKIKATYISGLSVLNASDKAEFISKCPEFITGSTPKVILSDSLRRDLGSAYNLSDLITIYDLEDGELSNAKITANIPTSNGNYSQMGTYTITYSATDSDGLSTNGSFQLIVEARKADLHTAITTAEAKKAANYTTTTFNALTTALNAAKAVSNNANATQSEVDSKTTALNTAITNLVKSNEAAQELATTGMTATAGNARAEQPASNVLDGDAATLWHTSWDGSPREEHYLIVDMGKEYDINAIHATPRNAGGNNGKITKYEVQVSKDGETYTKVAEGTWNTDSTMKTAEFGDYVTTRYIKVVSVESVTDVASKPYTSMAEFRAVGKEHEEATADKTELLGLAFDTKEAATNYTAGSYDVYSKAYDQMKALAVDVDATAAQVEAAVANYKKAVAGLIEKADKSLLAGAITTAQGKNSSDYSSESFAELTASLTEAKKVNENSEATQEQVDRMVNILNISIQNLETLISTPAEIPTANMIVTAGNQQSATGSEGPAKNVLDGEQSTIWHTSWGGCARELQYLTLYLGGLYDVSGITASPRTGVGNGTITKYKIQVSMDGKTYYTVSTGDWTRTEGKKTADFSCQVPAKYVRLISLESVNDFSSLAEMRVVGNHPKGIADKSEAMDIAYTPVTEQGEYTDASYKAYTDAIAAVQTVIANTSANQTTIDAAVSTYKTAYANLRKAGDVVTDKAALKAAIDTANNKQESKYTTDSYAAMKTALTTANNVYADTTATQDAVNQAETALITAMNGLKEKTVDKTALNQSISEAEKIDASLYTAESYQRLQSALDTANFVLGKTDMEQSEVDTAKAGIEDAISRLVKKTVDKTALANTIAAAKAKDQTLYTPATYTALTTALANAEAVQNNASAIQSAVDAQVKALQAAIDGLVLKPQDVSEIPTEGMSVTAGDEDSHAKEGPAANVLDGDVNTIWHTNWNGSDTSLHYIILDMGNNFDISEIHVTPRSGAGNGTITKYQIYTSRDGEDFSLVSQGSWTRDTSVKTAEIATVIPARYVKVVSVEAYSAEAGKKFASMAELRVVGKADTGIVDKTQAVSYGMDEKIEIGKYTEESYNRYNDAYLAVKAAIGKEGIQQSEVNQIVEEYRAAKEGLTEKVEVIKVTLNETEVELKSGEEITLSAVIAPENATTKTIVWSTSNPNIAVVKDGKVTAQTTEGEAVITATANNGVSASCTIKVQNATVQTGWGEDANGKYYVLEDGTKVTNDWKLIDNIYYHFSAEGYMQKKWFQDTDKKWYYLGQDGKMTAKKWISSSGSWYYMDKSGAMSVNKWIQDGGKYYYVKDNGVMVTGFRKIGSATYYMNSSGVMQTGWKKIGTKYYYFKSSGAMVTGWKSIDNVWYSFTSEGVMRTGWYKESGTWYYFKSSGAMTTGWYKESGTWYYFKRSGAMATGWTKDGSTWYYMNGSGAMQTGWLQLGSKWYYLKDNGEMATGWYKVKTVTYQFDTTTGLYTGKKK